MAYAWLALGQSVTLRSGVCLCSARRYRRVLLPSQVGLTFTGPALDAPSRAVTTWLVSAGSQMTRISNTLGPFGGSCTGMTEWRRSQGVRGWRCERPRWVRLSVALGFSALIWALGAVFWHAVLGHSWGDSVSFAVVMGVTTTGGQWLAMVIKCKQTDHPDS